MVFTTHLKPFALTETWALLQTNSTSYPNGYREIYFKYFLHISSVTSNNVHVDF